MKRLRGEMILASLVLQALGCGRAPEDYLREDMLRYGFIPYETPLQFAGTGTLVGGAPYNMVLVAPPETCFPQIAGDVPTGIRVTDHTELPNRSTSYQVKGEAKAGIFDALAKGNPLIKAKAGLERVQTLEFTYTRPQREYFDSIKLTEFYRNRLPDLCKDYLDKVGFISEAVKVDEMRFQFRSANSGAIDLTAGKILDDLVEISAGVSWKIEKKFELVITSPKYLGYRLGRLTRSDNGLSLCRASRIKEGQFDFQCLDMFGSGGPKAWAKRAFSPGTFFLPLPMAPTLEKATYRPVGRFEP